MTGVGQFSPLETNVFEHSASISQELDAAHHPHLNPVPTFNPIQDEQPVAINSRQSYSKTAWKWFNVEHIMENAYIQRYAYIYMTLEIYSITIGPAENEVTRSHC